VSFASPLKGPVLVKVALSYTSIEAARRNLEAELPHWDFDRVVSESRQDWNQWHALLGRRIVSDADGSYCDNTGK
jgi:putative alpha-1,2-mannosidase